jgi:hypothetical protein
MDGFFDLVKGAGKGVYDFFLFLVTCIFVLFIAALTAAKPEYHQVGILLMGFTSLLTLLSGRPISGILIFLFIGALCRNGYYWTLM